MHRPRSKRRQLIRATIVYSVMTTLVVVGLAITLLYVLGYRFDSEKRTLDQGGLIQMETKPSGAQILFDSKRLSGRSPKQHTASAGAHTVRMTRDGYRPWQKNITVEAGGVLWLNYILFIPEDLKSTAIRTFKNVDTALPIPGSDRMLVMESNRQPVFKIVNLDNEAEIRTVELPSSLLPSGNGRYVLGDWSDNGRALIMEYKQGNTSRWFIFDINDVNRSVDITSIVGASEKFSDVKFVSGSDREVYILHDSSVRRVHAGNRTVSAPLIENVNKYWQGVGGILTYVTNHNAKEGMSQIGYMTRDAKRPRVLQTVYTDESTQLSAVIGEYQNRRYLALQNDRTISVNQVKLTSSDSDTVIDMNNVAVINTEEEVGDLAFAPNNRFLVAQHDATYMTYDIELNRFTSTTLRGSSKVTEKVRWLDRYHIWSSRDNHLRLYEFDGENVQSLGEVVDGLPPQLSRNSERLYVFRPAKDGVALTQISLRVN